MTELLKRWAELEPERCSAGALTAWVTLSRTEHPVALTVSMLASERAIILAAVIEAITARGWSWELRGSGCPASARVTAAEGTYGCVADEPTDSPAFPLLAAYLRALEAEAGHASDCACADCERSDT